MEVQGGGHGLGHVVLGGRSLHSQRGVLGDVQRGTRAAAIQGLHCVRAGTQLRQGNAGTKMNICQGRGRVKLYRCKSLGAVVGLGTWSTALGTRD